MSTPAPTKLADLTKKLDAIFQPFNRSDVPGLVIGIAHRGRTIYRKGFGLASIEHATMNTPATRMRIGSTSKHFAALAAMLLAEDGKLKIDAPVSNYLPELKGVVGRPTLRQLMNHTSGLRDPNDMPAVFLSRGFPAVQPLGMGLEISREFRSANFKPGERMIYCNNGYHLLSLIVERVSGKPFAQFLKERILAPMGMGQTELLASDMTIVPNLASFHVPQPDGSWRRGIYPSEELLGSGGMISSIDDMLVWLAHLRGSRKNVGSAKTWAQMLEKPRYNNGTESDYCLGLTRETYRGAEILHHGGAVIGCVTQMLTVPAQELDIIVICNRMDGGPGPLALKVIDAVLGDTLAPPAAPPKLNEALKGRWYSPQLRMLLSVATVPLPGREPAPVLEINYSPLGMLAESKNGLTMASPAHGTVELPAQPKGDTLRVTDSGNPAVFQRLPAKAPPVRTLARELLGRYRYTELGVDVSVRLEKGALRLNFDGPMQRGWLSMEPLTKDVFAAKLHDTLPLPIGLFTAVLTVERKKGRVAGLWVNGTRTRNLWLERCR